MNTNTPQIPLIQRLAALLILTGFATILLAVVSPDPAEATQANYRWKTGSVCVIDHTGSRWPIYSATYRWTQVPDLSLQYGSRCTSRHKEQAIHVYEGWYGSNWHGGQKYGYATAWLYTHKTYGDWEWMGDAYRMYRCTIQLNNTYGRYLSWADRRSVIMHEMGHCSGIDHTSYSASLMNTNRWRYYDYPTWYDRREVERRYPW